MGFNTRYFQLCSYASGVHSETLYLRPFVLVGGLQHRLVLTTWTPGSFESVVEHSFLSNLPPYDGTCSVSPDEGKHLSCSYI